MVISLPIREGEDQGPLAAMFEGDFTHVLAIRKSGGKTTVGITATQLQLIPGDVVELIEKYRVGFWKGRINGKEGIFDADVVVPCTPAGEPLFPLSPTSFAKEEKPIRNRKSIIMSSENSEADADETSDSGASLRGLNARVKPLLVPGNVKSEEDKSELVDETILSAIGALGESPRHVLRMLRPLGNPSPPPELPFGSRSSGGSPSSFHRVRGIVRLNVGGKLFCTSAETLRSDPHSMLAHMFSGQFELPVDEHGTVFLDRDGKYFRYILNYLRDGSVVLPEGIIPQKELLKEAIYFQLPMLVRDVLKCRDRQVTEHATVRYLPGATYDGWPVRIEGLLEERTVCMLNGGETPPEREDSTDVNKMYGTRPVWKMRGITLTTVFNVLSRDGWELCSSNGSGAGDLSRITFAEMYVFRRESFGRWRSTSSRKDKKSHK